MADHTMSAMDKHRRLLRDAKNQTKKIKRGAYPTRMRKTNKEEDNSDSQTSDDEGKRVDPKLTERIRQAYLDSQKGTKLYVVLWMSWKSQTKKCSWLQNWLSEVMDVGLMWSTTSNRRIFCMHAQRRLSAQLVKKFALGKSMPTTVLFHRAKYRKLSTIPCGGIVLLLL